MKPEWIAIICTAVGMIAGFIATVSIISYRTGGLAKALELSQVKVKEMDDCIAAYRARHEGEHKCVDDNIHANRREIGEVKTLASGLDEWMKRLDVKMDGLFEAVTARVK